MAGYLVIEKHEFWPQPWNKGFCMCGHLESSAVHIKEKTDDK